MSRQLTLFHLDHVAPNSFSTTNKAAILGIEGLSYYPDFLHYIERNQLLRQINQQDWLLAGKRRVQHYGFVYDYEHGGIEDSESLGPLPNWATELVFQLLRQHIIDTLPNQLTIDEYLPAQGLANHATDVVKLGEPIVLLSLCAANNMTFTEKRDTTNKGRWLLEEGSLLVLKGKARYDWAYGIANSRYYYDQDGKRFQRKPWLTLTFRKVQ